MGYAHDGREWPFIIGSDIERDGLYLEVQDPEGQVVLEIFRWDERRAVTFTAFQPDLPLPLIEAALEAAKARLQFFED